MTSKQREHSVRLATTHKRAFCLSNQAKKLSMQSGTSLALTHGGHSLSNLIAELPVESARRSLEPLVDAASALDKLYIPTRYPNGLPNMMPRDAYRARDSEAAITAAVQVLEAARELCKT